MRSFAVWYSLKDAKKQNEHKRAKININLWQREDRKHNKEKLYCFDFGFNIVDISNIEYLYLYVPCEIKKEQIKDLGSIIINNKLVDAIFNEDYNIISGEPKTAIVSKNIDEQLFNIYSLDIDKQIDLETCKRQDNCPSTTIKIHIGSIKVSSLKQYYFRIRLELKGSLLKFINNEVQGVSKFSNVFTNTEIIDFRLNDVRTCSEQIREKFKDNMQFDIEAVHYLILRNANDNIIYYGENITSRMLEDEIWKHYMDELDKHMIAYHIKAKATNDKGNIKYIDNFTALTRFQYAKEDNFVKRKYVIWIIIFGAIGSIVGSCVYDFMKYMVGLILK